MEEGNKERSFWNVLGNIVSFGIGLFVIYSIISNKGKGGKSVNKDVKKDVTEKKNEFRKEIQDSLQVNERQSSILAAIRRRGEMTPSTLYSIVPNVSTRTLRRDMDVLVGQGLVRQEGSTKSTKYIYIG